MTNQHVVKPFTKICFLLKSISVLLACSQQCFSVHFCRKFVNITQICKYYANLQILHIFANVSQRNLAQMGSVFWQLHGAKEAYGAIFTMRRICILK